MFGLKFSKLTVIVLAGMIAIPAIGATVSQKVRARRAAAKPVTHRTILHTATLPRATTHTLNHPVKHKTSLTTTKKLLKPMATSSKPKTKLAARPTVGKLASTKPMASLPLMATSKTKINAGFGVQSMHSGHLIAGKK